MDIISKEYMSLFCIFCQLLYYQILLKSVNIRQSNCKNKKVIFFWDTVYIECDLFVCGYYWYHSMFLSDLFAVFELFTKSCYISALKIVWTVEYDLVKSLML